MAYTNAQEDELERDFALPFINTYRLTPSPEQVAYATDLCRSELTLPQRTIDRFSTMSRTEMSALIRSLAQMRKERVQRQPRDRRWRLVL